MKQEQHVYEHDQYKPNSTSCVSGCMVNGVSDCISWVYGPKQKLCSHACYNLNRCTAYKLIPVLFTHFQGSPAVQGMGGPWQGRMMGNPNVARTQAGGTPDGNKRPLDSKAASRSKRYLLVQSPGIFI